MTGIAAGIELGGTKCVCVLGDEGGDIVDRVRLPTTAPAETMAAIEEVLSGWRFDALGIASFGPIAIDPAEDRWGHITATTKPGWSGTDVAPRLARRFGVPVGFHTDVVGAAMAEASYGAAAGLPDLAYVTVGTGVGVGLIAGGMPLTGLTHSELGHLRPRRLAGDAFPGICPFHGDCIEGLAAGPAIAARVGRPAELLPSADPAWTSVIDALAQLCHTLVLTGIPRRIVFGGGVMLGMPHLLPRLRVALNDLVAGYGDVDLIGDVDAYLVPAALGEDAGPRGALILGQLAQARKA